MVWDCGPGCEESRMTYQLGGGEGAGWCQIVDLDAKRAGQHTLWRWRGSGMVLDCGPRCEERRTTYQLEVERERDDVRLWTWMRREQDDVPTEGGEGVGWCQIVDLDAVMTVCLGLLFFLHSSPLSPSHCGYSLSCL